MNSDQKFTDNTITAVAFTTLETKGGGSSIWSWTPGTNIFTIPFAGMYLVNYTLVWTANATNQRQGWAEVNNSGTAGSTRRYAESDIEASAALRSSNIGAFLYKFATNDTVQIVGLQNSGGDLFVVGGTSSVAYSTVSIYRLSE